MFVDGVRRIDARVWLTGDDGESAQGICASYAAGAVLCEGGAGRGGRRPGRAGRVRPGHRRLRRDRGHRSARARIRFVAVPVPTDQIDQLSIRLQEAMGRLEVEAAEAAGDGRAAELVMVDGPLRALHRVPGTVGYVKHHEAGYGAPVVRAVLARLAQGERTPVFRMGERFARYSWYVRLPGAGPAYPLAGVVRCEVAARDPIETVVGSGGPGDGEPAPVRLGPAQGPACSAEPVPDLGARAGAPAPARRPAS